MERTPEMPHVIVKLWPGESEQQKTAITERITNDVMNVSNYGEESVSVSIEEIKPDEWKEKVYKPDILNCPGKLFNKPRYNH